MEISILLVESPAWEYAAADLQGMDALPFRDD